MSEQQYTRLLKTRLTDLKRLQAGRLFALLSTRPEWVREAVLKGLSVPAFKCSHKKGGQPTRLIRGQRLLETIKFVIPLFHINPVLKS